MRRLVLTLLCTQVLGLASCARPAPHGTAAAGADPVELALLAQTGGFGGCRAIARRDTGELPYHPGLTVVRGTCVREHGDTAFGLVAVDRSGQVYVLDSPSSLEFMLRMHPPPPVAREQVLDYTVSALGMMGLVDRRDSVLPSTAAVPDSVLTLAGVSRSELMASSRVVQELSRGYEVVVNLLGRRGITAIVAVVYADSGIVRVTSLRRWHWKDG